MNQNILCINHVLLKCKCLKENFRNVLFYFMVHSFVSVAQTYPAYNRMCCKTMLNIISLLVLISFDLLANFN